MIPFPRAWSMGSAQSVPPKEMSSIFCSTACNESVLETSSGTNVSQKAKKWEWDSVRAVTMAIAAEAVRQESGESMIREDMEPETSRARRKRLLAGWTEVNER